MQDGRRRPSDNEAQRACPRIRLRRRCIQSDSSRLHQGGRCCCCSIRRSQGRTWNAGDAELNLNFGRYGAWRQKSRLSRMEDSLEQPAAHALGMSRPEAAAGGPIACLRDGDQIEIDLERRRLDVDLDSSRDRDTPETYEASTQSVTSGYLARYAALVGSADEGAILRRRFVG